MRVAREGLAAVSAGGRLYALGGAGRQGDLLESVEVYQTVWTPLSILQLDPGRAELGAVEFDGDAVLVGGFSALGPVQSVERFDPESGTVTPLQPYPFSVGATAVAASGDRVYVAGGRDADDTIRSDVYSLSPRAGASWQSLPNLPASVEAGVAAVLGDYLYVAGGSDSFGGTLATVRRLALVATTAADDGPSGPGTPGSALRAPTRAAPGRRSRSRGRAQRASPSST